MEMSVSPGIKHGTRVQVTTAKATLLTTGSVQTWTYTGNTVGVHNSSAVVTTPVGARVPTPWRVFAARVSGKPYNFTRGTPKWRHTADVTDTRQGFGPPSGYEFYGTTLSGGLRVPHVSQNLVNQVLMEASANLRDQKLALLVSFAEAKQTVSFLAEVVSTMARALAGIRRGDPRAVIRALTSRSRVNYLRRTGWYKHHVSQGKFPPARSFGSKRSLTTNALVKSRERLRSLSPQELWLEYRYAVLPLVYEVKGALAILDGLGSKPKVIKGRSRQETNYGLPRTPNSTYRTWEVSGRVTVGAECQLRATLLDPFKRLQSQTGLTAADGLIAAWELVPYSFVIDWIIPIGTMLSSFLSPIGLTFLDGYVNTKSVANFSITCCKYSDADGTLPSVAYQSVCQFRQPKQNFPLPRLYVKSPFSTTNIISAVALVTNLHTRR